MIAVGFRMPKKNILLTIGHLEDKMDMLDTIRTLAKLDFRLYATKNTHDFLAARDLSSVLLFKVNEPRSPNIREYLEERRVDLVINIPSERSGQQQTDGYLIRRLAMDRGIPLITNVQLAKRLVEAIAQEPLDSLPLLPWPNLL